MLELLNQMDGFSSNEKIKVRKLVLRCFFNEFRLYFLFQFLEYTTPLIFTFFDLNIYMSSYLRIIFSFFCSSFFSLPPLYLFLFLFHFSFFIPFSPLLFLFLFLVLFTLPFFSVGHSCNKQT